MFAFVEKVLAWVLLGIWPPVPYELSTDYYHASDEEKAKMRETYAKRHLRTGRFIALFLGALALKWAWELGLLAFLGLGSGVALSGDLEPLRKDVTQAAQEQKTFRIEYRIDRVNNRIQDIDSELFQIELAINAARAARREPDALHLKRKTDLEREKGNLNNELAALTNAQAAAAATKPP